MIAQQVKLIHNILIIVIVLVMPVHPCYVVIENLALYIIICFNRVEYYSGLVLLFINLTEVFLIDNLSAQP